MEKEATDMRRKRSKKFSQLETDLLLSLVLSSNVNSMETNRMTTKGRSVGWETICVTFNASPGVVQRTKKELRERSGNIRKDLYKLIKFQRESVLANGGGHLPPHKPPKISFELTEMVKRYAASLQIKLAGLEPHDSDKMHSSVSAVLQVPHNAPVEEYVPAVNVRGEVASNHPSDISPPNVTSPENPSILSDPPNPPNLTYSQSPPSPPSPPNPPNPPSPPDSSLLTPLNPANLPRVSTLPTAPNAPQMFATQKQRRQKRTYSCCQASSSSSASYFEEKTKLLADENKRRNEVHEQKKEESVHRTQYLKRCVQIKDEELAMRKHQTEFWSLVTKQYMKNPGNISEIVCMANIANSMESTNPIRYGAPQQSSNRSGTQTVGEDANVKAELVLEKFRKSL
ncbi:uncharacterized protein LOC129907303 isoform X2 [Episyrphus balteatus]|uniref:uncharacterized protein LOC129907303 isoform X2 n=1 Tax=Episyrphus balteatus TaxID=286459 RepID=UPI0024856320|nr:uncharacterized protein LOC129907303 isoform X2 [Episyrphus balteatus]